MRQTQAPSLSGEGRNLATALRAYEIEAKVWKKLFAGYMPDEGKGLRLWQRVENKAKRMIIDEGADQYYVPNGIDLLVLRLRELFGDMMMVELGDRLDEFFDRPRRRAGENLRDYVHRFQVLYLRLREAGSLAREGPMCASVSRGSC